MKSFILDTCALIFALDSDQRAKDIQAFIDSYSVNVSVINFWEIAVKSAKGKLKLSVSLESLIKRCGASLHGVLPIIESDILEYRNLLRISDHKDPFDLMLIAQCSRHGHLLLTTDSTLLKIYPRLTKNI